jgi:hypothetical protein
MRRISGWWQGCRHGRLNHQLLRPKQAIPPGPEASRLQSREPDRQASLASYSSVARLFCLFSFVGAASPILGPGTPLGTPPRPPARSRWLVSRPADISGRFYPSGSPMRLAFVPGSRPEVSAAAWWDRLGRDGGGQQRARRIAANSTGDGDARRSQCLANQRPRDLVWLFAAPAPLQG